MRLFLPLALGLYCPLSLLRVKRLWYALRLSTRGAEECLSRASSLGVMDLTLPAFDNEPCDGTYFTSFFGFVSISVGGSYKRSHVLLLQKIYL